MDTATAVALAIQLLPLVTAGTHEFIAWIEAMRTSLQQADEWTDEQEASFRAALWAKTADPAYQPDPN